MKSRRRYLTADQLRFEIQFQRDNIRIFHRWPRTVAQCRKLLEEYEQQLVELLHPLALPREKDPEDRAA